MPDRRLAAILAADVVGYSALMAEDEAGALEALRRLRRELFHPAVAGHRGKIVKSMGDGWLVEFASAVDAVNCAVQVQNGLESDPKIRVRIGIHVGDITHEDEDIYGDGVNVAARLEALAEPGAVAVSDAVYGSLDGTLTPLFDDHGVRELKNLPRPVQTWMFRLDRKEDPVQSERRAFNRHLTIVPVTTSDPRAEVEELAAAITNDLSQYLSGGRWLSVLIAQHQRSQSYVLSARLRTRANRLRLEIVLSDPNGAVLWADKHDGFLEDSFGWQDETAANVSSEVFAIIQDAETNRLDGLSEDEQTAETWMLRALLEVPTDRLSCRRMIAACSEVVARDPDWGRPYSLGLIAHRNMALNGWQDELENLMPDPEHWLERATSLSGSDDPGGWAALAYLRHRRSPDLVEFRHRINSILRHAPNNQGALLLSAIVFAFEGDPALGLAFGRRAISYLGQSKAGASAYGAMAGACIRLSQDEEAADFGARAIERNPNAPFGLYCAAAAFAAAGRLDQARETVARVRRLAPAISVERLSRNLVDASCSRRFLDCLRLAGLPEGDE